MVLKIKVNSTFEHVKQKLNVPETPDIPESSPDPMLLGDPSEASLLGDSGSGGPWFMPEVDGSGCIEVDGFI